MAEQKATLYLQLKDEMTKGLRGVIDVYAVLKDSISTVTNFLIDCYKEFGESREAAAKLEQALINLGGAEAGAAARLQEQAAALQKVTIFADEAIVSAQAMLVNFGMTEKQVSSLIPVLADYASAMKVDISQAAFQVGKAIESGMSTQLMRMGIIVEETAFKQDALGAVTDALAGKYTNMAAVIAGEPAGQLAIFQNQWSELKETMGELAVPVINLVLHGLLAVMNKLQEFKEPLQTLIAFIIQLDTALITTAKSLIAIAKLDFNEAKVLAAQALQEFSELTLKNIEDTNKKAQVSSTQLRQRESAAQKKANLDAQKENEKHYKILMDARRKKYEEDQKTVQDMEVKMLEWQNKNREEKEKNFKDSLDRIASLSTSHNKTLAAVGKATSIAIATVDTYQAANKALASAPPPWNFALAAGVVAAGLANVAQISGVQLAEGGVVLPRSGGTLATIAEAGKAEAVIPLDDPQAMAMLGGGGQTVVNINAGLLVADNESMRKLTVEIDKHLYALKRNNQTLAV